MNHVEFAPITRLPPELLVGVFGQIPDPEKTICSLVCGRWWVLVKACWPDLCTSAYELLYYGVKNGNKDQTTLARQMGATLLRKGLTRSSRRERKYFIDKEIRRLLIGLCESVVITENGPLYGKSLRQTAQIILVYQHNCRDMSEMDKDIKSVINHYVFELPKDSSRFIIPVVRKKASWLRNSNNGCICWSGSGILGWEWTGNKSIQFIWWDWGCTVRKIIKLLPGEKRIYPLKSALFTCFGGGMHISLEETPENGSLYFYEAYFPSYLQSPN